MNTVKSMLLVGFIFIFVMGFLPERTLLISEDERPLWYNVAEKMSGTLFGPYISE